MNTDELSILIDTLEKSTISSFYMKQGDFELSIEKNGSKAEESTTNSQLIEKTPLVQKDLASNCDDSDRDFTLKSPLVGIYYNAPSPDAPAFKKVGDSVKKGETVAVLEAMKIFNEIKSPIDGKVKSILVSNQDIIEYDQALMIIERDDDHA
ncbi:MAG TPA: acetyl-CoA carboxylase biotin carboxyl carrier protein [Eubacteriaceae bacterium]|nr:acetyl-CoA carboxylase biotin carboxyl carrier protein [Eubacteriaceae bacterium]